MSAEGLKTTALGLSGTSVSVALQNFNQGMAGLAGLATLIYMCLKIYDWLSKRKES